MDASDQSKESRGGAAARDQEADEGQPIPANPLPPEILEGDSADTDQWDDNDTPPRPA